MVLAAALPPARAETFPVRMVKLGGAPSDAKVLDHVAFARTIGFNALWVYGSQAGRWQRGPSLDRAFGRLARRAAADGTSLWVSINPVADTGGAFVFSEPEGEERIVRFAASLAKRAAVRNLVLSFDDQPTSLTELRDVLRYGKSAAPAHLDLVRRVAARLPAGMRLWMCASAYCDAHLAQGDGPYSKPFLEGLTTLPPSVGIVWTGPEVVSPKITRADVEATRARLGGREILLYDNAPMNDGAPTDTLALVLAPVRDRDAALGRAVAAYLACPLEELGASRFSLLTIADYLRDPAGYDPEEALRRAQARMAGPAASEETRRALDTQQLEWSRSPRDTASATTTARRIHDPAFVASFTWTAERYPGRMAALSPLPDPRFRDDVLLVMRRRLAVARALPLVLEYLARRRAGRADAGEVLDRIEDERRSWAGEQDTREILDIFLRAAEVPAGAKRR